jgi:hypothetical protein
LLKQSNTHTLGDNFWPLFWGEIDG